MKKSLKIASLAAACVMTASTFVSATQDGTRKTPTPRGGAPANDGTLVVPGALEWLIRSDLSAKREGVMEEMLFEDGGIVQKGQPIGKLDDEVARLSVEKQDLIARSMASIEKAIAQREQAQATYSRYKRLGEVKPGYASQDELDKAAADVNYADALLAEAQDKQAADKKDLELANTALQQHQIIAPFNGVIIKRLKNPGEAVQANEAVVRLGNTDKFKFVGWITLENGQRVRRGDPVVFRPIVDGADLSLEGKVFTGKILAVGSEIPQVGNPEVSVIAEIVNPFDPEHPELSLLQGLKGELTITPSVAASHVANKPAVRDPAVSAARAR